MCRAVEEYGDMRAEMAAENRQTDMIKNLMDTMKLTPEEAMNALKIPEKDRVTLMKKF
jgi:hypothetical protein